MAKLWTPPTEIHLVEALNNRKLDTDYIGSLAESMEINGYLPQYPIEVFESTSVPSILTDKPYLCACGVHRTHAALKANLETVLIQVHEGGEEAFIETMSLDNFKFDVATNSEIGQAFTQKEKRAACIQLLLLPKYLKKTNTALAAEWNASEGAVRNWRKEVVSYINEGINSNELHNFGVSAERVERLQEVLNSPERENAEGKAVKVRGKAREVTDEDKYDFYRTIRQGAGWYSDNFLEEHGVTWDDIEVFMHQKWKLERGDPKHLSKQLSMHQMQQLHSWIFSEDAEFLEACQAIAKQREAKEKIDKALRQACEDCESALQNKKWVHQIPETPADEAEVSAPTQSVADVIGESGHISMLHVHWIDEDVEDCVETWGHPNDDNTFRPMEELPEHLLAELLAIAKGGKKNG